MKKIISLAVTACLLLAVILTAVLSISADGDTYSISGMSYSVTQPLYVNGTDTGVTHTQIVLPSGSTYNPYSTDSIVNVFEVSPSNTNVSFAALNCGSYNYSRTTLGNAVLNYNSAHTDSSVIAAVNSDPWLMHHTDYDGDGDSTTGSSVKSGTYSVPRNILIIDGEIWNSQQHSSENYLAAKDGGSGSEYAGAVTGGYLFAVKDDGTYMIGLPSLGFTLKNATTDATLEAPAGLNRLPGLNAIMIYNHRIGAESLAYDDAYEIYLKTDDSAFGVSKTNEGVVVGIYESGVGDRPAIDENTIVISARGTSINKLAGKVSVGDKLTIKAIVGADSYNSDQRKEWKNVTNAVGGFYLQMSKGQMLTTDDSKAGAYPCPMIGLKEDGTVVVVTIASQKDGVRDGTKQAFLNDICNELGLYTALMFDGGGSTTTLTYSDTEGAYVRHGGYNDGSTRAVINGLAIVYKGADFTGDNLEKGSIHYLPQQSTTNTETFVGVINNINGFGPDGTTGTNYSQLLYSNHVTGVKSADAPTGFSDRYITLSGWFASYGGQADELKWSIDGGSTWIGTLSNVTWSDGNSAHQAAIEANQITDVDLMHVLFTGATIDLWGYGGRTLDITIGRTTSWGDTEAFATITNVNVPTTVASIVHDASYSFAYAGHIESINGQDFDLYGYRDPITNGMSAEDKLATMKPAIVSEGISLVDGYKVSISGWAQVRMGLLKYVWSVDGHMWFDCTGDVSDADTTKFAEINAIASSTYNVDGANANNAIFENLTADLSNIIDSIEGDTVTVYFGAVLAYTGYTDRAAPLLKIENVSVCHHVPNIPSATCTEDQVCTLCNSVIDKATGHTVIDMLAVEPNCVDPGHTAGQKCKVCGYDIVPIQEIPAKGHTSQPLPGKAPTCMEEGFTEGTICSVCNTPIIEQTKIPKVGHKYTDYKYNNDATCTADGTETAVCDYGCNTSDTRTAAGTKGHTWGPGEYNNDATCTENGTYKVICSVCGEIGKVDAENTALGHKWAGATCTSPKTCEVCQATEGDALGHDVETHEAQDATCTADGWREYETCKREGCGYSTYEENVITSEGHKWVGATCTSPKTCSVCGITEGEKLGHDLETVPAKASTCTEGGWNEYVICKREGCEFSTLETNRTSALGHKWADPTCTSPKTCEICHATEGEALGHTYDDDSDRVCNVCGYEREIEETPTEAPTEEPTEAPTEEITEEPTEEITDAPTEKQTEKQTEAQTQSSSNTGNSGNGGCGSTVGISLVGLATAIAAGYVLSKKRR